MPFQLAVLKYRAVVNPTEVFELDVGSEISSNPKNVFFLNDFLIPENLSIDNKILSSELTLKVVDTNEIKILKDYQSNSVRVSIDGVGSTKKFFEIVSELLKSPVEGKVWTKLVLDCVRSNINNLEELKTQIPSSTDSASQGDISSLITQASEGLTKEESDKLFRLRETSLKIQNMETEVSSYQNQKKDKEDLKKNKDKLDTDVKGLEEKLSSVNMLIVSQNRIKSELDKFNTIDTDSTAPQKVEKIKENRSQSLSSSLKTLRKSTGVNMDAEEKEGSLLVAKWMIVLVGLQLALSLVFFIITLQVIQLLIGVFSAVVILILMLLVNVSRYSYKYNDKFQSESPTINLQESLLPKPNLDEDRLILNNAWSRALQGELDTINTTISSRLGDKNLDQIASEKEKLLEEQKKLDSQLSGTEDKALNTEEYYKKRRELDILKIEKENIEFSLEGKIKEDLEDKILALSGGSTLKVLNIESLLPLLLVNCKFIGEIADFINTLKQSRQVLLINF